MGIFFVGVGYSIEPTADGNVKFSVCENLTAAVFRGFTPISHVDGRQCNLLPVITSWEENDLSSTSTDSCRSSERRVCLNTMAFLMLSGNVIHPSQVARNVCFIFCLLVSSQIQKWFLTGEKKAKDWFSLLVTRHIFVTKNPVMWPQQDCD